LSISYPHPPKSLFSPKRPLTFFWKTPFSSELLNPPHLLILSFSNLLIFQFSHFQIF
ncbi:hypothetical protein HMPREF9078_00755, partial [Capnocytophaga sp. oral taxon 380 str. F0488]